MCKFMEEGVRRQYASYTAGQALHNYMHSCSLCNRSYDCCKSCPIRGSFEINRTIHNITDNMVNEYMYRLRR